MTTKITPAQLIQHGCDAKEAEKISGVINAFPESLTPSQRWQKLISEILTRKHRFSLHEFLYQNNYPHWTKDPCPAWFPSTEIIANSNLAALMQEQHINDYKTLHAWSVKNYPDFWKILLQKLNIKFHKQFDTLCDLSTGVESPQWLKGAKLNIATSCFTAAPSATAILFQAEGGKIQRMTYAELDQLSNQVANGLIELGCKPGAAIAIDMVMTPTAVAILLGIIKAGCVVVSIADSFAAEEIAVRLRIAKAKIVFTQDCIYRSRKKLPLYEKVIKAGADKVIVVPAEIFLPAGATESPAKNLRTCDFSWDKFLSANTQFDPVPCDPNAPTNILFSSGTTGDPKAIPWSQTTPIKCGSDAFLHQNIKPGDVLVWPSNIGWMMGPWLDLCQFIKSSQHWPIRRRPHWQGLWRICSRQPSYYAGTCA